MLNLIRNNFPKGYLVRFLTVLTIKKLRNDSNRICQKFPKIKREETLSTIKQSP
jgi:hypothetical protein